MIANIILGYILPFILLVVAGYLIKNFRDDKAMEWIKIAVRAAEQIFAHGENEEKFKYVSEWISKKFNIAEADLKNLIEGAVYELNEEQKKKKSDINES